MSITIQANPKGTPSSALASWIDQVAKACKNRTSERREADGQSYPWAEKTFTGMKCPSGLLKVRRQNEATGTWRISMNWPEGRGGKATGLTASERIFVFSTDEDLYAHLDGLRANPRNPQPLEIVPHEEIV